MPLHPGTSLGPYQIQAPLGAGGMGEVYKATDTRLDRTVAIKVLPEHVAADPDTKQRFEREARAVAALNHPHICTLHDIGSQDGVNFLVMEHLDGQTLRDRLAEGALNVTEAVQHGLTLLATLETVHRQHLVHRDLKPANVFLTPNGLKLLDFGLAVTRRAEPDDTALDLTHAGTVLGTPRYMAPETLRGQPADERSDLFAVGALLYEMIAGSPAFDGESAVDVIQAVVTQHPPMLTGSSAVVAADRVIHRALEKEPGERYQTAAVMAQDLREVLAASGVAHPSPGRQARRIIVLPFRMLRPDPDAEFLSFSLPDAITASLSGLDSVVVRSTLAGGEFATERPDLKRLAQEAEVDLVLIGSLLRSGDRLQVNAQLLEAPRGTVIWSFREQVDWREIFQVQEELTQRIVDALSSPLSTGEGQQLHRDVPSSPTAYEDYLRANQLASTSSHADWRRARDLYLRCVQADPSYAPAWARLGRIHRVLGKFWQEEDVEDAYERARHAFERALELNPELPVAHALYTGLEVEVGRAHQAMCRLVERAKASPTDPHLFTGLVVACRYCGLLEASLAADGRLRRIDPKMPSSVVYTLLAMGRYEEAADRSQGADLGLKAWILLRLGRLDEALALARDLESDSASPYHGTEIMAAEIEWLSGMIEGSTERVQAGVLRGTSIGEQMRDPEAWFGWSGFCATYGDRARGLRLLKRAVDGGYFCVAQLLHDPWFDALRTDPAFVDVLRDAEAKQRAAAAAFTSAGGDSLLGLRS